MKLNKKGFSVMLSNETFSIQIAKCPTIEEARTYATWINRNLISTSPNMYIMLYPDDLSQESERV